MGLFDIFGTGDQQQAAQQQIQGINTGLNSLNSDFTQGQQDLSNNYSSALQPFTQNYNTATQGTTALGNALGLNGASGNAAATAAFNNNPGYQFQKQQGDSAITAADAASGKTASGNEALALSNYNQGLAGTSWNNYVNSLQPFLGASNSAATGVAGVDTGLGNQLNASQMNLGNAAYGANTSIGNANANASLAGLNASANSLGALSGLANGLMMFSDENVKDDIEPVGELFDGQKVYKYRYKGDSHHQIGLIAQEVEDREPDAVGKIGGIKAVNYDKATSRAAELGRFLEAV